MTLFNVPLSQGTVGLVGVLVLLVAAGIIAIIRGSLVPASQVRRAERAADKTVARLEAEIERAHAETDTWRDACEFYRQAGALNSQHLGLAIRTTSSAIDLASTAQSASGGPDASAVEA